MKRKTDDLEKLDGTYVPTWLKTVITIVSAAITFLFFYFLQRLF